jgi:20S proteasome alpha/beta subunit
MIETVHLESEIKRLYRPPMRVYTAPKQKDNKAMTVAIGFISKKGIMLAADREITHV